MGNFDVTRDRSGMLGEIRSVREIGHRNRDKRLWAYAPG